MNFLYPGFLFSLLAVAIPILIHLFNFRRFKTVYFSNVQFLKAVKEENASAEKLKNLLILFCRILAIVFLVLAFARPYFYSDSNIRQDLNNMVYIYIDNSYSMENQNKEGSLLDEAKRRAKEIAKAFSANDRFLLTTNDFEGKHQRKLSYEELVQQIDEVKISPVQRSLQQVLYRQHAAFSGNTGGQGSAENSNSYSYIISDFQDNFVGNMNAPVFDSGQHNASSSIAGQSGKAIDADENMSISLVKLTANGQPNIAVDSIWSLSPAHRPNDQEKFVVQLRNYGEENSEQLSVKLTINNQQKALARISIPAGKVIRDTLRFSGLTAGWQKGTVTIKDFPVTFDDELNFSFKVNTGLNVLHISAASTSAAPASVGPVSAGAVGPGGIAEGAPEKYIKSLFSADPYFRLSTMQESNIDYSSFSAYPLIIVSGLKSPSSGLAEQLKNHVLNGGSVVIFPNLDGNPVELSAFLTHLSLPAVQSLNRDTVNVSTIDLKNSLFADVFEQIPARLDLPKVNRHFIYTQTHKSTREDVMSLPFNQLFFARYRLGGGQIYLCSGSLDIKDSNLPLHPVFLPLMYKTAFLSVQEQPLYYTVGENTQLSSATLQLNAAESLRLVSATTEVIPEVRQVLGKTLLYIADQVKASGFYELKKADSLLSVYAFNDNRKESDMNYASRPQLEKIFGKKKVNISNSAASLSAGGIKNNSTELWKLCIVLCAVCLALEVILIKFFNNPKYIQKT